MSEKTIDLKPSYTFQIWWYIIGALLVPLFGIGLIVIYLAYRKQSAITYKIGNQSITKTDRTSSETVNLADIHDINVQQRWIDKKLNTGRLVLITEQKTIDLAGIQNPQSHSDLILQAAKAERIRLKKKKEIRTPPSDNAPISLDRLDYLTGLWQQGLLSDEDFKEEKKHFES
tara:strand:- start:26447 stop:26965 length:519 start_codon:yes stop_codon:yes gene_type:complete